MKLPGYYSSGEFAAKAQRQRDDVDRLAATAHALARGETPPQGPAPDQADEQDAVLVGGLPEVAADNTAQSDAQSAAEAELDPLLLDIFRNEALAHLETLVAFLADCAQELPQPVTDDLQRALHTLKGSAFMAGILPIAEIAAPLEKMVKEFKANLIPMDLAEAELLRRGIGSRAEMVRIVGCAFLVHPCNAEIDDDDVIPCHHDIGRFQITMDDGLLEAAMKLEHRIAQPREQVHRKIV